MNADLCVVEIGPGMAPIRRENLMSNIVYSATGDLVRTTMIGGDLVYHEGNMLNGKTLKERYLDLGEKVISQLY